MFKSSLRRGQPSPGLLAAGKEDAFLMGTLEMWLSGLCPSITCVPGPACPSPEPHCWAAQARRSQPTPRCDSEHHSPQVRLLRQTSVPIRAAVGLSSRGGSVTTPPKKERTALESPRIRDLFDFLKNNL